MQLSTMLHIQCVVLLIYHELNNLYIPNQAAVVTHQSGVDVNVRSLFFNNGSLADTQDTSFRAIDR